MTNQNVTTETNHGKGAENTYKYTDFVSQGDVIKGREQSFSDKEKCQGTDM